MSNIPIDIPPGIYKNGTEYGAAGRWRDGNQIRFFKGLPQPIGGWTLMPIETEIQLPQYREYDGDDAYHSSFNSAGNKVFILARFNSADFTGIQPHVLASVSPGTPGQRVLIEFYPTDYINQQFRNRIAVYVYNDSGSIRCFLFSKTAYLDEKDHILFFSYDGDNGLATFIIDGENADDEDNPSRFAPIAGTLGAGATTIVVGDANTSPGTSPYSWIGKIGFFAYDDQYLTNWADFMEGNLPKTIDETTWEQFGGNQPKYFSATGSMDSHQGSEAAMSVAGSPTLVDSDIGVINFLPGYTRRMVSWRDTDGQRWLAVGTTRGLFAFDGSTLYDITPAGLLTGEEGVPLGPGYGSGLYGTESYGTARTQVINSIVFEPGAWALDTWGENLVGVPNWDGNLYEWSPSTPATPAQLVAGDVGTGDAESPQKNRSLLVTNERHLVLLGAGDFSGVIWNKNPRKIWFSSSEDNTDWLAEATNSAGDLELKTNGVIQCGVRFRNENIIWTTTDVHRMSYINPPNYYGVKSIGAKAGIISQTAYVVTDNFIFWVGPEGFHLYDGSVHELESEVWDYYIDRLNKAKQSQISVGHNPRFNEIWIFYPAGDAALNTSYLIWNYKENVWSIGELPRTAWDEALIWDNPIGARPYGGGTEDVSIVQEWAHDTDYNVLAAFESPGVDLQILSGSFTFLDPDTGAPGYGAEGGDYQVEYVSGIVRTLSTGVFADNEYIAAEFTTQELATPRTVLYFHEDGYNDEHPSKPIRDVRIESAPFEIGYGDKLAVVRRLIQDTGREDDLDPVLNSDAVEVEFDTRLAPEGPKTTHGPYTLDTTRGYTDVRFTGRQVAMRIRQTKNELWRLGRHRLEVVEGSER